MRDIRKTMIKNECNNIRKYLKNEEEYIDIVGFLELEISHYLNENIHIFIVNDKIYTKDYEAYTFYMDDCFYVYIDEDIYEKACEGSARERFTIAHEVGHIILHNELLKGNSNLLVARPIAQGTYIDYVKNISLVDENILIIEKEADLFAASLLVPNKNIENLKTMEIRFKYGVSETVARIIKKQRF